MSPILLGVPAIPGSNTGNSIAHDLNPEVFFSCFETADTAGLGILPVGSVAPGCTLDVPVKLAYASKFQLRPSLVESPAGTWLFLSIDDAYTCAALSFLFVSEIWMGLSWTVSIFVGVFSVMV